MEKDNIFKRKNEENAAKISEDKLQADCFQWFHNTYTHLRGLLYHVPNGEKRDKITANLLKAKGVVAGIPDLVFHYRARTYFFELKRPDGKGVLSKAQKDIHRQLDNQRFIVYVVDDYDTFRHLIQCVVNDTSQQFTHGITKADYYYKHKIFDYIYSLSDAEVVRVADITEEDTRPKFMNYVAEFMAEGYDKLDNFELLFTPDYKAIYKVVKGSQKTIVYNG